jgi:hypothetical protein
MTSSHTLLCPAVHCLQLLSQKLASLSRVLPAADVARLVARTPQLLLVPSSTAVQILVDLVAALPGENFTVRCGTQCWQSAR